MKIKMLMHMNFQKYLRYVGQQWYRSFKFFWIGIQAAQHCVLNTLRTPLGKP